MNNLSEENKNKLANLLAETARLNEQTIKSNKRNDWQVILFSIVGTLLIIAITNKYFF